MYVLQYQTNSSTQVTINPEFDYNDGGEKIESRHRTPRGREFVYNWGSFSQIEFTVRYVSSADRAVINSWWDTNADLLFMESDGTDVRSVVINNDEVPIAERDVPYEDQWTGTIRLGTY